MATIDILRIATQVTFLGCFGVAVRAVVRTRSEQARWLATVFGSLAVVVVVGMVRGPDAEPLPEPWSRLLVLVLAVFPWSLFRFSISLTGLGRRLQRLGDGATAVLVVFTLLPGSLAAEEGVALTGLQVFYIGLFLAVWGAETITAGALLVRARRGQAQIVSRRLRLLSIATVAIGLALFASAGGGSPDDDSGEVSGDTADDSTVGQVAGQALGALSGVLFLIGFAPPRLLRAAWRHDDERKLYDVAVGFLTATSTNEVVTQLLPGIRAVLGAPAVALLDESGQPVAVDGTTETDWTDGARTLLLHDRPLAVQTSTRMPLIGEDEEELIDRLGLLTALATDRAQLIVSERQARAQAEEASERLAALNAELEAFLYSTSHDLKNPVIALVGYVDLLQTEFAGRIPDEAVRYLERLDANSKQIEALINDLLELSRVGRVEAPVADVDLNAVVDGLAADLAGRYPQATLRRSDLPTVRMSPQRAVQLFGNLVENACRYSGRDDVTIEVAASTVADSGSLRLTVTDDGVGIPADQAERVFGMFERLDPDVDGGTGMGLAICRRIVEHLGGTIRADSPGDGAKFVIDLPAAVHVGQPGLVRQPAETS